MGERLGLLGTISIALGGMIGGGIFAVLGAIAQMSGTEHGWPSLVVVVLSPSVRGIRVCDYNGSVT